MAVAQAAGRLAAPTPRPWWRGRAGLILAIVVGMIIAFFGLCVGLVWGCDKIIGPDDTETLDLPDDESVAEPAVEAVSR